MATSGGKPGAIGSPDCAQILRACLSSEKARDASPFRELSPEAGCHETRKPSPRQGYWRRLHEPNRGSDACSAIHKVRPDRKWDVKACHHAARERRCHILVTMSSNWIRTFCGCSGQTHAGRSVPGISRPILRCPITADCTLHPR